jgi:hypothetical protein
LVSKELSEKLNRLTKVELESVEFMVDTFLSFEREEVNDGQKDRTQSVGELKTACDPLGQ